MLVYAGVNDLIDLREKVKMVHHAEFVEAGCISKTRVEGSYDERNTHMHAAVSLCLVA